MKKENFILYLRVALCILIFLYKWFVDCIDAIFPLIGFFTLSFILIFLFFMLYLLPILLRKKMKKIDIIILILIIILVFFVDFRIAKIKFDSYFFENERKTMVEEIKQNKDIYKVDTMVELNKYHYIFPGRDVYIYENNKKDGVFGFYIFHGVPDGSIQLIYSSSGKARIEKIMKEWNFPIISIRKIDDNWYYVILDN